MNTRSSNTLQLVRESYFFLQTKSLYNCHQEIRKLLTKKKFLIVFIFFLLEKINFDEGVDWKRMKDCANKFLYFI